MPNQKILIVMCSLLCINNFFSIMETKKNHNEIKNELRKILFTVKKT
jgi:hypothetical protein